MVKAGRLLHTDRQTDSGHLIELSPPGGPKINNDKNTFHLQPLGIDRSVYQLLPPLLLSLPLTPRGHRANQQRDRRNSSLRYKNGLKQNVVSDL